MISHYTVGIEKEGSLTPVAIGHDNKTGRHFINALKYCRDKKITLLLEKDPFIAKERVDRLYSNPSEWIVVESCIYSDKEGEAEWFILKNKLKNMTK